MGLLGWCVSMSVCVCVCTWVKAVVVLDVVTSHTGGCAGDSVHVGEELDGTQGVRRHTTIHAHVMVQNTLHTHTHTQGKRFNTQAHT